MIEMNEKELKLVKQLQDCLDEQSGIRENFGPKFKHKLGKDHEVSGHKDHIHFSVNSDHKCTPHYTKCD